jgi:hypothetical protein
MRTNRPQGCVPYRDDACAVTDFTLKELFPAWVVLGEGDPDPPNRFPGMIWMRHIASADRMEVRVDIGEGVVHGRGSP